MTAGRVALAAALAAAAVLCACDSPPATTCAGERVGTFRFRGEVVPDAGCPFPSAPVDFTGTVAAGSGTSALLCIDRPDAEPLRGELHGDHLLASSPDAAASVTSCTCQLLVAESVEGDVVRGDGGSATGFSGELRAAVSSADAGASCEPDAGPGAAPVCGVPCEVRWRLTGS